MSMRVTSVRPRPIFGVNAGTPRCVREMTKHGLGVPVRAKAPKAKPRRPATRKRRIGPISRWRASLAWIRVKAPGSAHGPRRKKSSREHGLVTVCEEAGCPNIGECWEKKHATFMIMGDTCTRACAFCNVKTGLPRPLDPAEPARVAGAIKRLGLAHAVITSVDRDDLSDGGAGHFASVVAAIRAASPSTTIEVLTPDFLRKQGALELVVAAKPDVFNHNLETVASNYLEVRPGARYFHSIRLLQRVKELDSQMFTKSGMMLGLGEGRHEVLQVMDDLRTADVDFLTHWPISAADEKASCRRPLRAAGGICVLRRNRARQGVSCSSRLRP